MQIEAFHSRQIIGAQITVIVAMFFYAFAPADRKDLPQYVAISALGFLFGKFTNGFTRIRHSHTEAGGPGQSKSE